MARNIAGIGALSSICLLAACGDPVPPAAQVSLSLHLDDPMSPDPEKQKDRCSAGRHWVNVPYPKSVNQSQQASATESGPKAVHGQDGNSVTCTVKPNGSGFKFTGNASGFADDGQGGTKKRPSTVYLNANNIAPGATNAVGGVRITDDQSVTTYSSETCLFSVSGDALGIDAGRIWGKVFCEYLNDPSSPGSACSVDTGFYIFENCAQ